jgi:hypothetical protein
VEKASIAPKQVINPDQRVRHVRQGLVLQLLIVSGFGKKGN